MYSLFNKILIHILELKLCFAPIKKSCKLYNQVDYFLILLVYTTFENEIKMNTKSLVPSTDYISYGYGLAILAGGLMGYAKAGLFTLIFDESFDLSVW